MRYTRAFSSFGLSAITLVATLACSARDSGTGSNTHFLRDCDESTPCSRGLSCICGLCTVLCDTSETCSAIQQGAECKSVDALPNDCSLSAQGVCQPPSDDPLWAESFTQCATVIAPPSRECDTEVCIPNKFYWLAQTNNVAQGLRCTDNDSPGECSGLNFSYRDQYVYLTLFYDKIASEAYSTEAFAEGFHGLSVWVFPPNSTGHEYSMKFSENLVEPGDPSIVQLTYANGRIMGRLELGELSDASRMVEGDEESCVTGDIASRCYCEYAFPGMKSVVEFDLPVEGAPEQ